MDRSVQSNWAKADSLDAASSCGCCRCWPPPPVGGSTGRWILRPGSVVGENRPWGDVGQCPDYPGDLNRSTQHLLILLDKEVADGDVTDIVHGEAEG